MQTAVTNLQNALTPWLEGTNPDAFLYDTTYGGIVTTDGIASSGADYGNGWYNDHHLHYGYFAYSFAALVRFSPEYAQQYQVKIFFFFMNNFSSMVYDSINLLKG